MYDFRYSISDVKCIAGKGDEVKRNPVKREG
jgi:hypothetical protein